MTLEHYCSLFSQLRRAAFSPRPLSASRASWSRRSKLSDLFTDYWRSIVRVTQTSSIVSPFSRLHIGAPTIK